MNILVSACLLGINCRYNGVVIEDPKVKSLKDKYGIIPVCPEMLGGFATLREPSEIKDGRVFTCSGKDVTMGFIHGAQETLTLAKLNCCEIAVFKERSPSCGCKKIYDGSFSGEIIDGNGIAAGLLLENGINVIGESEAGELL
ncbi:MAG: DUF523 domain-containing protein [Lachnospiraceae bacterium]|nr:DUF523 domain-containing protein [Lachnospiraceae bacterium]